MITAPSVPDFQADNFKVNDRRQAVIKDNNRNRKLDRFATGLQEMVDLANAEFKIVAETRTEIAQKAGQVAQDRQHVNQQKGAIDTTADQVNAHAQQVATDRQAIAQDRQASQQARQGAETARSTAAQAAQASSQSASAAQQAKQSAEDLYGDLDAINVAKTASQQAAQTAGQQAQAAGQERGKAETARTGAEEALRQAIEAAKGANVDIGKALEGYVVKDGAFTWNGQKFGTVKVHDARDIDPTGRNSEYLPEPDQLGAMSVSALFSTGLPGNSWRSALLVNGWNPTYTSWILTGPSGTSVDEDFYLTSGRGTAWGPDRRVWHDGNLDPEDASNLKKGAIPAARIVSTTSRTHSGSGVMLEASAM
ncbi:hypothetical protein, partial [Halomonas citrativorans]|uniref:hypothetical protein n=1 Tax=Halomonas citrativorans TaxID=2742612 RepID=UPI001C3DFD56